MFTNPNFNVENLYDIIKKKDETTQKLTTLLKHKQAEVNKFINLHYDLIRLIDQIKSKPSKKKKVTLPADIKPFG